MSAQRGSQTPRQYVPVPQNPYSEQQGADSGQLVVALHVDWAVTMPSSQVKARTVSIGDKRALNIVSECQV